MSATANPLRDPSLAPEVRRNLVVVTLARLAANACYRFSGPFLAIIATGLDATISQVGVAIAVSELTGLASPAIGRLVDRASHRASMTIGLAGTAVGCTIAAAAPSTAWFALGVTVMVLTRQSFDIGLGAWIAAHVPYQQRGRIVGLTETSWALGLLVGVSLMGALTAAVGWRAGFGLGVAAVVILGTVVAARVDAERPVRPAGRAGGAVRGRGWLVVAAMFVLMVSAQSLFVTFGPWFEDRFGFDAALLSALGFALGAVELVASTTSARRTDRWGKERSVALGSLLIVPGALLVVAGDSAVAVAVAGTAVWLLGFEFAVVSMLPMATHLAPDSPGTGLGWVLGAGALGRALAAVLATSAYERGGIVGPAVLGAACAVACAGLIAAHAARQPR